MSPESLAGRAGYSKTAIAGVVALAAGLGVAAWLLAPSLLPVAVPADFPDLPNLDSLNPPLRKALREADQEARRKPASAEAVGKLGMVYHANLMFQQAAAAYRIATRLAPQDYRWIYCHAVLQEESGNENEQITLLRETLRLKPDHTPALLKLADWSFKTGSLDEAQRLYELAASAPDGAATLQASFGLGRVAGRRREWAKIVESITPLTHSYPHAAPLYELLREAHAALGQPDRAEQASNVSGWAKWKAIPPFEDPLTGQLINSCYSSTRLLKQAGLLSRVGQAGRAIEVGRRAVQVDPADPDVRNFLARTLLTFYGSTPEAIDEAMTHLAECLKLRPKDPVPLGGFADEFFKSPKPPAAIARLRTLLLSRPDIPGVHFFLGQAADELGETGNAVAEYTAALRENPKNSAAHNKLGLLSERDGNHEQAVAHFRKAIQLNPANTAARLNLAISSIQQGNFKQGLSELDELLRIDPHDASARFCLGFALLSLKRIEAAVTEFRKGLLSKPDDAEARFGLGSALAMLGRRDEALAELREAVRLRPDHSRARGLIHQLEQ